MAGVKRILVLDDEKSAGLIVDAYLKKAGFRVSLHQDPYAALEAVARGTIDLVVTDFILGPMTGLDFVRILREREYSIPVVLVSGSIHNGVIRPAASLGIRHYLPKPIDEEALIHVVRSLLARSLSETPPPARGVPRE